jgi:hypothetical protein
VRNIQNSLTKISFVFALIICIAVLVIGCMSGYKGATVTKSGLRFLFEYPTSYSDYEYSLNNEDDMVILFRYLPNTKPQTADRVIRINTWITTTNQPNARAFLKDYLKDIPRLCEGFKLIEQSPIKISGIYGEMIKYSGRMEVAGLNTEYFQAWDAYLDYKGQIITIAVYSDNTVENEAKKDFDHLLKSFKFLD